MSDAVLAEIIDRLNRVEAIASSAQIRTPQEREDKGFTKAAHARMKRIEVRMAAIESKRAVADKRFIEKTALEVVGRHLPQFFVGAAEDLVDSILELKANYASVPKKLTESEDRIKSSTGSQALSAKNAAQSTVTSAADHILAAVNQFSFGAAQ